MNLNVENIKEIIELVVSEQLKTQWVLFVIVGGGLLLSSAFGAYFGSFFKKRGELEALKLEQKEILKQLKLNARATEQIKNDIEHDVWKKKEAISLKTEKLEAFLETIIKLQAAHVEMQTDFVKGKLVHSENYPNLSILDTVSMRQKLYFPELLEPTTALLESFGSIHPIVFKNDGSHNNSEVVRELRELDRDIIGKYHNLLHACRKVIESALN
ncbi:TPA: hypothetical protein ACGUVV_005014 [Vibrio vulnificus]|nr:hypothetical protein CRN36_09790 [Vibrio vulnificus]HDY8044388.1 hypothetical protein [Vibrio vulnificus]